MRTSHHKPRARLIWRSSSFAGKHEFGFTHEECLTTIPKSYSLSDTVLGKFVIDTIGFSLPPGGGGLGLGGGGLGGGGLGGGGMWLKLIETYSRPQDSSLQSLSFKFVIIFNFRLLEVWSNS